MTHTEPLSPRAEAVFKDSYDANSARTSRVFAWLMVGQWLFGILIATLWSPYAWAGKVQTVHVHVWAALFLGAAISSLPLFLTLTRPAAPATRFVVAVAQMMWSALIIHLTGGRIEAHFHVFVSLAFLAFYRDWRVLVPATLAVVVDHLMRGIFWPESVYGVPNPEWWRFVEHAFWVVFEDAVLILACLRGVDELRVMAARQAEVEAKSTALEEANRELERSREALAKLAEVGQLAASVGHELRNPLAAVRNGLAYVTKRSQDPDPNVQKFLGLMDQELEASSKIIGDLLEFARERPLDLRPCPLAQLVDEAISLVPQRANVKLLNEVSDQAPIPVLDKEHFRQVLINLIQNGTEAIPAGRSGVVRVHTEGGGDQPWRITVSDDGVGIDGEALPRIFQPLFTTKTKGTGLGLAIVQGKVRRHGGTIEVRSELGKGSTFHIQLPPV